MAQTTCQKCGNHFATSFKCSNCGQYPKNVTLTPSEKSFGFRIIGYIFFGIAGLYLILLCCSYSRIKLAIAILKVNKN